MSEHVTEAHITGTHDTGTPGTGHDVVPGSGGLLDAHHDEPHDHGLSDMQYVYVALILAVMTAMEVGLSYAGLPGKIFMPALFILMAAKFWTVVSFFMHLKFDNKIFSWLFYSGLLLAVFVFVAALATFHLFETS
jgi:cytochrome c oxidase subunit 4